jgi:hypothetical protein
MDYLTLELLAPMAVAIILILTVGGVVLLRPLSKRLGDLLEVMAEQKRVPGASEDLQHIRAHLDTVNSRLALLEERQDFQEKLLGDPGTSRRISDRSTDASD